MIRKVLAGTSMALAVAAAGPQLSEAQTLVWADQVCAEASFNPCVDFELYHEGGLDYSFVVTYLGSDADQQGYMTAAGLYDYDGDGSPWEFTNLTLVAPTTGWSWGDDDDCEKLSGGGDVLFEGCVQGDKGIKYGVAPGDFIKFTFTSNQAISASDFASLGGTGDLGARAMIQGVDEVEDCSYKLDSPQGLVSGCGGEVVPEPMTVLLLATGLVGVGAVGYRNRRREDEEV